MLTNYIYNGNKYKSNLVTEIARLDQHSQNVSQVSNASHHYQLNVIIVPTISTDRRI